MGGRGRVWIWKVVKGGVEKTARLVYKIATYSQPGHVTKTWAISTSIISVYSRPGVERLEWVGGGGYGMGLRVKGGVCLFVCPI